MKLGVTRVVTSVLCEDEVVRVRLERVVTAKGDLGDGMVAQAVATYLDGTVEDVGYTRGRVYWQQREARPPAEVIQGQTRSIADFGRLESACAVLCRQIDALPADASAEQMESLMRSHQGLLAWLDDARARVQAARGQVDVVTAKLVERLW